MPKGVIPRRPRWHPCTRDRRRAAVPRWRFLGGSNSKFEDTELSAVSCNSASACLAVGLSLVSRARSLAERWDGRRWSIIPPPRSAEPSLGLRGVSCISRNDCLAVGGGPALAEWWNGQSWKVQRPPGPVRDPAGRIVLVGVSCPSSSICYAVGNWHDTNGDGGAIVERWTAHTRAVAAGARQHGARAQSASRASPGSGRVGADRHWARRN